MVNHVTSGLGSVENFNPIFNCVENLVSFYLSVLLTESHGLESDFTDYKVRFIKLCVPQQGIKVLLGIGGDGRFDDRAPLPPEASGSTFAR